MKKCPMCAEEIQDAAIKCKHCGELFGEKFNQSIVSHSDRKPMVNYDKFYDKPKIISKSSLMPGEKIFFETRPDLYGIVILLAVLFFWTYSSLSKTVPFIPIFLFCCIIGTVLSWRNTIYALTDKRVLFFSGLLGRNHAQCPIEKIQNTGYKRYFLSNVGDITFDTAGTTFKEIVWKNIDNAGKTFNAISPIINK